MFLYATIYVCHVCEVLELPLKRYIFQVWMFSTIQFQASYKFPETSNISQHNEKASSQLIVSLQAGYLFPKLFWYCYVVRVIKMQPCGKSFTRVHRHSSPNLLCDSSKFHYFRPWNIQTKMLVPTMFCHPSIARIQTFYDRFSLGLGDLLVSSFDKDVGGLEVSGHHLMLMQIFNPFSNLEDNKQCLVKRHRHHLHTVLVHIAHLRLRFTSVERLFCYWGAIFSWRYLTSWFVACTLYYSSHVLVQLLGGSTLDTITFKGFLISNFVGYFLGIKLQFGTSPEIQVGLHAGINCLSMMWKSEAHYCK